MLLVKTYSSLVMFTSLFEFVLALLDKELADKNDTAVSRDNWLISSSKLPYLFLTVSLVTHFKHPLISVSQTYILLPYVPGNLDVRDDCSCT